MATERERMAEDIKANGFDHKAILASIHVDAAHEQRAYIALKLFQIEEHLRRLADAMVTES